MCHPALTPAPWVTQPPAPHRENTAQHLFSHCAAKLMFKLFQDPAEYEMTLFADALAVQTPQVCRCNRLTEWHSPGEKKKRTS